MYVLNFIRKKITKMNKDELAIFLNDCSRGDFQIENHIFAPNKKLAKEIITETLEGELPKCKCWK